MATHKVIKNLHYRIKLF